MSYPTSRAIEIRWVIGAFALLAATFLVFPQIDLIVSGWFHPHGQWLLSRDSIWLLIPYRGLPRLGQLTLLTLITLFALSAIPSLKNWFAARHWQRATLGFLLVSALVGPALFVDVVLKDHSGRARPINISQFGGDKTFSPAFFPADQCRKNCSFVSGHVATASFLMVFGWLGSATTRRRWLLASLVSGGAMGIARMIPGGHFLSDVIFAWFAVYFSLWAVEWGFRRLAWLEPH